VESCTEAADDVELVEDGVEIKITEQRHPSLIDDKK
jgi:hypothetical protein